MQVKTKAQGQVLYVKTRQGRGRFHLLVQFDRAGHHTISEVGTPRGLPYIRIHRKEYERILQMSGLRNARRPLLTSEQRREHMRVAGERYRKRVRERRRQAGVEVQAVPFGMRAPDSDVEKVLSLIDAVNPATGRPYLGVEIAILVGRSQAFVSRVKNGSRRAKE